MLRSSAKVSATLCGCLSDNAQTDALFASTRHPIYTQQVASGVAKLLAVSYVGTLFDLRQCAAMSDDGKGLLHKASGFGRFSNANVM